MKDWIRLIRVKHWVKNGIIFLPLFFGKNIDVMSVRRSIVSFIAFSFIASSIYIFNDILDIDKDRVHPIKCKRPIASGKISTKDAMIVHFILVVCGLILLIFVSHAVSVMYSLFMCLGYYVINVLYTVKWKNIPLLDVVILSSGFLIRLFLGSSATGITISSWLYLVIMSGAFYLGLSKRRNELMKQVDLENGTESREVLKHYTYHFLDNSMNMCMTLAIVFYSLWCAEYNEKSKYLLFTVPLFLIILMKYNMNIEKQGADGDPTDTILGDWVLLVMVIVLGFGLFAILYIL